METSPQVAMPLSNPEARPLAARDVAPPPTRSIAPVVLPTDERVVAVSDARLRTEHLDAFFGTVHAVHDVSLKLYDRQVTAIIGPSGCGKSTLLRCLNRMHETAPGARVAGTVLLDDQDIYRSGTDPVSLRRHVGMVFQRPTPFPTMSITENVSAGLKMLPRSQRPAKAEVASIVERALVRAGLWNEMKDRLSSSPMALSGGQQQRLCIARALAASPAVLLLDEPTASLDPQSTQRIEELVHELRQSITVVIVTHNMQQAARISDRTAFMLYGDLVEITDTRTLFTTPRDSRTEAYITGRFG